MPSVRVLAAVLAGTTALAGCLSPPVTGLECEPTSEGNLLTWNDHPNATSYEVWRAVGSTNETDAEHLANTTDTEYLDENVTEGTMYTYWVTAVDERENRYIPDSCTVTAIPFFPGAIVAAVAVVGGVAAYAVFRRRKR